MIDFIKDNAEYLIGAGVATVTALAPVATAAINKFGTPKQKAGWHIVRSLYRKALMMKKAKHPNAPK